MRVAVLFLLIVLLTACGGRATTVLPSPSPGMVDPVISTKARCMNTAPEYWNSLQKVLDQWNDGIALASSTSRLNLAPVIARLQEIKQSVSVLDPPECAVPLSVSIIQSMDAEIAVYLAFMRNASEPEMFMVRRQARYLQESMDEQFQALRENRPARSIPTPGIDSVEVIYRVDGTAEEAFAIFKGPKGTPTDIQRKTPIVHGPVTLTLFEEAHVYARGIGDTGSLSCEIQVDGIVIVRKECKADARSCVVSCNYVVSPNRK